MCKGFILLHRQLEDNWLWLSEPFTKGQAWVDLLILASHSGNTFFIRGNKIELKTGEIGYSKEQLASRWKWSRKKVLNFLKMLEKEQQIEQQKTPSLVVVRIVNYEKYQKKEQQTTQQKNNRKPTEEHKQIIKNNDNNDKEINNERFEEFWNLYDYKKSKPKAILAYEKAIKIDSHENILNGVKAYIKSRGNDKQYWKHPTTWLNAHAWQDEYNTKNNKHNNFEEQDYDEGTEGFNVV